MSDQAIADALDEPDGDSELIEQQRAQIERLQALVIELQGKLIAYLEADQGDNDQAKRPRFL